MDVYRLETTEFKPDYVVEGYTSMIWTERYRDPGEFQLKTSQVEMTKALLPELSLISIRNSREVMLVENHSIDVDDDGNPELTVSGRSLDAFFEKRFLRSPSYGKRYKMAEDHNPNGVALILMFNSVANPSGTDVTQHGAHSTSSLNRIPGVVITNSVVGAPNSIVKRRWLSTGQVQPQLLAALRQSNLGVRTIRPDSGPARVVNVTRDNPISELGGGVIEQTTVDNITDLRFDTYNGVDRTVNQDVYPTVVFNYAAGHIDKAKYLFSIADYRTMAYITSSVGAVAVYQFDDLGTELTGVSGLERHELILDGGEPADGESTAEFLEDLDQPGVAELKKRQKIVIFDGEISPLAPYNYNEHYNLGDLVTLQAEYGVSRTMQVWEFTRTEDTDGDRGYPGLIVTN